MIGYPRSVALAALAPTRGQARQSANLKLRSAKLLWLTLRDRPTLYAIAREWRGSLLAGCVGAFSTLVWFFAFALESAPRVRTLGLIEAAFAQILARRLFHQSVSEGETLGVTMISAGVALALNFG